MYCGQSSQLWTLSTCTSSYTQDQLASKPCKRRIDPHPKLPKIDKINDNNSRQTTITIETSAAQITKGLIIRIRWRNTET